MASLEGFRLGVVPLLALLFLFVQGGNAFLVPAGSKNQKLASFSSSASVPLLRRYSSAESGTAGHVENLTTLEALQDAINQEGLPVVFRYHATWCRACKAFQPKWETLATEYGSSFRFCDVDITGNKEIVKAQQLTVLPHIQMYKDGSQIENFSVSVKKLPTLVEKLDQHKKKA